MDDSRHIMISFVQELQEQILWPMHIDDTHEIITLMIKNLFIYLYPPQTSRQGNNSDRQTIHIDQDQILSSSPKIINRLKGMLGIGIRVFARHTVAVRIDKKVAMQFQEEHHLQVALSGKYRYGLYYRGELVSIAVFSGGRHMLDKPECYRSFELLRFCHKGGYSVIGGISKLIHHFAADFHPSDIMTYADLDWCQQSSLERIGFKPVGIKEAQIFYVVDGVRKYEKKVCESGYTVQNSGSIKLKLVF